MRWNIETKEEYIARLSNWHRWLAWRPVRIAKPNAHNGCGWKQFGDEVVWANQTETASNGGVGLICQTLLILNY
jgi:hypothetical protein